MGLQEVAGVENGSGEMLFLYEMPGEASLISDVRDLKEVRQEILWVLGRRQGTFQAEE